MLSKEKIERAKDNLLRGNDIESACLIMEEVVWNNLVITGGRVNIIKVAMRQILNFIQEYKNKGYIDIIREKVQLKEKNNQLEQENNRLNKMIDEMAMEIASCDNDETFCKKVYPDNSCEGNGIPCWDCVKQYFEKKVEEK